MGGSHLRLLAILLILTVSTPCFSQGFGGKEMKFEERYTDTQLEVELEKGRTVIESAMDYQDPGANTNPRNGYILSPPPPRP